MIDFQNPMAPIVSIVNETPLNLLGDGSDLDALMAQAYEAVGDLMSLAAPSFDANLADFLDDDKLGPLAKKLMQHIQDDSQARESWITDNAKGLTLLGLSTGAKPDLRWEGASDVVHPVVAEAALRYQANAIEALFPAIGPAKIKMVGKQTKERLAQGQRVRNDINNTFTQVIVDAREEIEVLLLRVALAGAGYIKAWWDAVRNLPRIKAVSAAKMLVPSGYNSIHTAPRLTELTEITVNDFARMKRAGVFRNVDIGTPTYVLDDRVTEKERRQSGVSRPPTQPEHYQLAEMHIELDLENGDADGIAVPYIVVIDTNSQKILSIRRNWKEGDPAQKRIDYYVRFQYMPGLENPHGMGLVALIGTLARGSTQILRTLIDTGSLAAYPSGFKAEGLRWKNEDRPFALGEWRDAYAPSGSLKDSFYPLPVKEPSQVLQMLGQNLVDEARRLGSIGDLDAKAMSSEAPVGTVIAILEQVTKIQSAVHSRLHASFGSLLQIEARLESEYGSDQYAYETEGDMSQFSRRGDYIATMRNIVPVSDPNAATMGLRMMQLQAVQAQVATAPDLYNLAEVHRRYLETLGVPDIDGLMKNDSVKPLDPVTENMNIMMQKGVAVGPEQDHDAHIAVHMAFITDPINAAMIGQSQYGGAIKAALEAHVLEHQAWAYRNKVQDELGVQLPPGEDMPPEVENQIAGMVREASDRVLGKSKTEAAAQASREAAADPVNQIQLEQLAIEKQKATDTASYNMAKLEQDKLLTILKLIADAEKTGKKIGADLLIEWAQQSSGKEAAAESQQSAVNMKLLDALISGAQNHAQKGVLDGQAQ
jgi:hypothetical protein